MTARWECAQKVTDERLMIDLAVKRSTPHGFSGSNVKLEVDPKQIERARKILEEL